MRNPNGYGSVAKLSGNRRKPYVVRKTVGFNEKGYPIYYTIAYCPTREEGNIILADFNKASYNLDIFNITMEELFKKFCKTKLIKMSASSRGSLNAAFGHCRELHNMKYREIKSFHMQSCIDNCGRKYSTQWSIRNLFSHLDKLALELDIITKGYSKLTTAESIPETNRQPFTEEEIALLWAHSAENWVESVLIFIYSGFRLSELLNMEIKDINLSEKTFMGGMKTVSGKNRIVPIHPKIFDFVKRLTKKNKRYLFEYNGEKVKAVTYYTIWKSIMEKLGMTHTPHECRHTFRSRLDSAGANKKCIDLMMGHKSKDVGERIYTHKSIEELREALELLL